jgi:hypothetical protein
MKTQILLALPVVCLSLLACSPTATTTPTSTNANTGGGGGSSGLTAANLASGGSGGAYVETCSSIGSSSAYGTNLSGSNYSILKYIYFTSSTYSLTVAFISGTTCGGTTAFQYLQSGTYTLGSATSSPSGGYQILYTASSSQLEVFGGSFSGAWATTFNGSNCAGGFGGSFSTSGTTTLNASGLICNTNGVSFSFPATGSFYDVIVPSSLTSPATFYSYSSGNVLQMGQFSSYPTTATQQF